MAFSPAYKTFEKNANFPDGRTMQAPVTGTIARDQPMFHFAATPQDAISAGEQLTNPFLLGAEEAAAATKRGHMVFQTFCTPCHGGDGTGNGPIAQRGFPPPPSLMTGKSLEMKDGQLFHILTLGQNSMPNFAAQLPPSRRWDVITYLRKLQEKEQPTTAPAVESGQENTESSDDEPSDAETESAESGEKP